MRDPEIAVNFFEPHPEVEALALEQVGDLLNRFLANVFDLEQVILAELDKVAERPDVRVLERIQRADREPEVVDQPVEPLAKAARRGRRTGASATFTSER